MDFTVASRMTATVSMNPVCYRGTSTLARKSLIPSAHQVRPDLVDNSLLVKLVCVFWQVVQQGHTGTPIWTRK